MNNYHEHNAIFNISGCLNDGAIREYIAGKLPPDAVREIEMHLSDCPLCSDAVEGYLAMAPGTDVNAVLEEVRTELFKEDKQQRLSVIKGSASPKKRSNRFLYIGLAASLVFLIAAYFVIRMLVPVVQKTNVAQFEKSEKSAEPKTGKKQENKEDSIASVQTRPEQDVVVAGGTKNAGNEKDQQAITATGKSGWFAVTKDATIEEPAADKNNIVQNQQSDFRYDGNANGVIAGYTNPGKAGDSVIRDVTEIKKTQENDKSGISVADNEVNLETMPASRTNQPQKASGKGAAKRANKKDAAEAVPVTVAQAKAEEQTPVAEDRKEVNTGADEYKSGNYRGAIDRFEEALKTNPDDDQALYYCGMSYYYNHQNDKALQDLEKVLKNKKSSYYQAAEWQTAVIYRETSQKAKAKKVLNEIIDENGTYKQNAIDAVNEIDK
jgi:Flp pilus assembly protein TadD